LTNCVWSVSRNIDRLTMDEEDEGGVADRRAVPESFSAGLVTLRHWGLLGFVY